MKGAAMIVKISQVLWIGAAVLVLAITLYAFDGTTNSDIGIFFVWCMLVLSFPSGLLISLVHVILYDGFSVIVETTYLSFGLDWVGFLVIGYIQWFVMLPWLWHKCKIKRKGGA